MIRVFFFIFVGSMQLIYAQNNTTTLSAPTHRIFLEAGGSGGYGSIQYEKGFSFSKSFNSFARIGLGTYSFVDYQRKFNPVIILPVIGGLHFGNKHLVEIGWGITASSYCIAEHDHKVRTAQLALNASLAYCYRTANQWNWRLGFTPLMEFNKGFRPWFGLAIGKTL